MHTIHNIKASKQSIYFTLSEDLSHGNRDVKLKGVECSKASNQSEVKFKAQYHGRTRRDASVTRRNNKTRNDGVDWMEREMKCGTTAANETKIRK